MKVVDFARSDKGRDLGALCLLLGFALGLLWPILGGQVPIASNTMYLWAPWSAMPHEQVANVVLADSTLLYLPWQAFNIQAISVGEWPQWNPYSFGGISFAANSQNQLYYPVTWLLWLLPLSGAIQVLAIFNVWLAAGGVYMFVRHLGSSRLSACLAGMAFAGSGMLQLSIEMPAIASVYGWLPWMLYLLDRAIIERSARWGALAALACGMQLVAGNLQWAIYSFFALGCWAVWRGLEYVVKEKGWSSALRSVLVGVAVVVGGVLLALVHLLPVVELTGLASRADVPTTVQAVPFIRLLRFLMPSYYGTSLGGIGQNLTFNNLMYVGIGPLVLAVLAVVLRPRRVVWFWAGMALFALGVFLAIRPFEYVQKLPILRGLINTRVGYLVILAICVLAGLGLDVWNRVTLETPKKAVGLLVGVAALPLYLLVGLFVAGGRDTDALGVLQGEQLTRGIILSSLVVLALAVPLAMRWRRKSEPDSKSRWGSVAYAAGLVALLFGDLVTEAPGYNKLVRPEEITPTTPAISWLQEHAGNGQVLEYDGENGALIVPNVQMIYAIRSVAGYDSLHTARYDQFWGAVDKSVLPDDPTNFYSNVMIRPQAYYAPQAALLGVRYVASTLDGELSGQKNLRKVFDGDLKIYEKQDALPKAFVVESAQELSATEILSRISAGDFDAKKMALLDEAEDPPNLNVEGGEAEASVVTVTQFLRNTITVQANMPRAAWLVMTEPNYPGWEATVDGKSQKVYTADYLLRSVPLEAGAHTVVFTFTPSWFWPSLFVGLVVLGVIIVLVCRNERASRWDTPA